MTPTAFVAVDPQTRLRLGVAWSEIDAWAMVKRADERVTDGIAELIQVPVSRTPQRMREARRERARQERHAAERARAVAKFQPPPGYTVRRYPPLAESTLRKRFFPDRHLVATLAAADDWTTYEAMAYGQDTIPMAKRGYVLIADPPKPSMPRLYILTPKGRKWLRSR